MSSTNIRPIHFRSDPKIKASLRLNVVTRILDYMDFSLQGDEVTTQDDDEPGSEVVEEKDSAVRQCVRDYMQHFYFYIWHQLNIACFDF